MKSTITSFLVLVVLGMLMLPGVNGVISKKTQTVGAAAANRSAGFEVLAVMEKKEFRVDEPLILKLSMRNVTRKALLAFESNPETDYLLDVTDVAGKHVALTEYGRQILSRAEEVRLVTFTFQPGEKRLSVVWVNKLFAVRSPGTYYITAKRRVPGTPTDLRKLINISSNKLRVVITKS